MHARMIRTEALAEIHLRFWRWCMHARVRVCGGSSARLTAAPGAVQGFIDRAAADLRRRAENQRARAQAAESAQESALYRPAAAQQQPAAPPVRGRFHRVRGCILAEIYLCPACSCHDMPRVDTPRGQVPTTRASALRAHAALSKQTEEALRRLAQPKAHQPPVRRACTSSCSESRQ
eukprot:COSAG01_NODE_3838_length_5647_cov_14.881399_6_plen_177_part_00